METNTVPPLSTNPRLGQAGEYICASLKIGLSVSFWYRATNDPMAVDIANIVLYT